MSPNKCTHSENPYTFLTKFKEKCNLKNYFSGKVVNFYSYDLTGAV